MTYTKPIGIFLAVLALFPYVFAAALNWWEPASISKDALGLMFLIYSFVLFLILCVVLIKHPTMPAIEKRAWVTCLMFTIPLASLIMLYFAFWYKYPSRDDSEDEEPLNLDELEGEPEQFVKIR